MAEPPEENPRKPGGDTEGPANTGGPVKWTGAGILSLVASWLVTNFIVQPVNYTFAVIEFYSNKVLDLFWSGFTNALGTAGGTIASELTAVRATVLGDVRDVVASAGLAAPFAAGTTLTVLVVVALGTVAVALLYVADYIPGGSLIS